ncbi:hypothetical protein LCI18_013974 [Fusarium solani-melongenae]|uniref:Uncharacterized protein n=1 Tax=Fusarium solani subsp. cucurbitae TaxID=2747967 RepID=A0ACD3ZP26_FUSSC|nr:hypothetical protein LCI18_013974 [Fusarium solani-melongenae]
MTAEADATRVEPVGLALVHLICTIIFAVFSSAIVGLRCWVRVSHHVFATDDGLMLLGWLLYMFLAGVSCHGVYVGLGTRDERLNAAITKHGRQFLWLFQMFYCSSLIFIKASICVTLLRIAVARTHRIIAWATLTASCISTCIVLIGLLAICQPVTANWDLSSGKCAPPNVLTSLSYLVSASSVVTDLVCAILPGFMLYKSHMKTATKISISIVLGLGVLASIATIIRFPYIPYFNQKEDYLYNACNIALWSVFETGIGIIAGSLPSLRRLLKTWINLDLSNGHSSGHVAPYAGPGALGVTSNIGTTSRSQRFQRSIMGTNAVGGGDDGNWEQLDDDSSKRRIYVTVDMEMQTMQRTATSVGSHESAEELATST